jgi:hypothetical protein
MTKPKLGAVPEGVDPDEFERRVRELTRTMPRANAIRQARKEFVGIEASHAGLKGKALEEARKGKDIREQIAGAKEEAKMAENNNDQGRGRKADPKSDRRKVLAAALKAIQDAGEPLTRKELEERVKVRTKGKTSVGAWIGEACSQGLEVDGHRFTRPKRGTYGIEAVA